ncbi:MAG: hypothetical protein H6Q12_59 [Bacteroidetes bacterium]|nr:hypothetical protein [Bacteroidota bacterium]
MKEKTSNAYTSSLFTRIKSRDNRFEVVIEKPDKNKLRIATSFSLSCYKKFTDAIDKIEYLKLDRIQNNEDKTSFMYIELLANDSLTLLINHLPELIYLFIEKEIPESGIYKGTADGYN